MAHKGPATFYEMQLEARLMLSFKKRCKRLSVPQSVVYAAWHQVHNQHLTMIVWRTAEKEIKMWFKSMVPFG